MKLWNKLPKGLRAVLVLVLMMVMMVSTWLLCGRPLPTFHTALRCVEQQHMLGPGEVLLRADNNAIARTDTHLRYITLHKNDWMWSREGRIQSQPLDDELTVIIFDSFEHQVAAYTPLEGAHAIHASLTVGHWTGQTESAVNKNGACFLPMGLPDYSLENAIDLRNAYRIFCRQRAVGLDYTGEYPITLTVTVYDESGAVLTELREEHPGQ